MYKMEIKNHTTGEQVSSRITSPTAWRAWKLFFRRTATVEFIFDSRGDKLTFHMERV